jgi:hypothetical protein
MAPLAKTAPAGRNHACPCGSGRKFKHCCEAKRQRLSTPIRVLLIVTGALLITGIVMGLSSSSFGTHTGATRGIWSAEHGHYH